MPISPDNPLILASTSRYRAELLERLRLPVVHEGAHIDESPHPGESAMALAVRLARAKSAAVAERYPDRWVLGADQVASCGGRILGKPGSVAGAIEQLEWCSGRAVTFITAICLSCVDDGRTLDAQDQTTVQFRPLSRAEIERYVEIEPALDCAGSFKAEGFGISLFERIESQDPTALVGLPLIAARQLLTRLGYAVP